MPLVLDWVLGGYQQALKEGGWVSSCRISDQPAGFSESDFPLFMRDDDALLRAAHADWLIAPAEKRTEDGSPAHSPVLITDTVVTVGRTADCDLVLDSAGSTAPAADLHAQLQRSGTDYFLTDVSEEGTWVNGNRIASNIPIRVFPGDDLRFGPKGACFKIKMQHKSLLNGMHGIYERRPRGAASHQAEFVSS
jgi:hypothetical protein